MNVDVVIPAYNAMDFIEQTLQSVAQQTLRPGSVIVVDDGSTDGTANLVTQFAASSGLAVRLIRQPNAGLSAARNAGLRASTAEFVALLDADDVWLPSKLALQMEAFARAPQTVGVIFCGFALIDDRGAPLPDDGFVFDEGIRGDVSRKLRRANLVAGSGSAVVIRRSVLEQSGYFDTALPAAEDWDMWIRMAQVCEYDYVRDVLLLIRRHSTSMQRHPVHMLRGKMLFADKHLRMGTLDHIVLADLRRGLWLHGAKARNLSGYQGCSLRLRLLLAPACVQGQRLADIAGSLLLSARKGQWQVLGQRLARLARRLPGSRGDRK